MKIASDINTELWNTIIDYLQQQGWKIISQYNGFDAGIDYNAYTLEKNDSKVAFTWDNWSEGEIICEPEISEMLKIKYALVFNDIPPQESKENKI